MTTVLMLIPMTIMKIMVFYHRHGKIPDPSKAVMLKDVPSSLVRRQAEQIGAGPIEVEMSRVNTDV